MGFKPVLNAFRARINCGKERLLLQRREAQLRRLQCHRADIVGFGLNADRHMRAVRQRSEPHAQRTINARQGILVGLARLVSSDFVHLNMTLIGFTAPGFGLHIGQAVIGQMQVGELSAIKDL